MKRPRREVLSFYIRYLGTNLHRNTFYQKGRISLSIDSSSRKFYLLLALLLVRSTFDGRISKTPRSESWDILLAFASFSRVESRKSDSPVERS